MFERLRGRATAADDGVSMVETIVALLIVAIVAIAAAAFFINNIRGINGERQRQEAAQVANQQIQNVEALPISSLTNGRSQSAVTAAFASSAATRLRIAAQDDESAAADYDSNGNPLTVPIGPITHTVNNVNYQVTTFIDRCWFDPSTGVCGPTQTSTTDKEFRASVDVFWTSTTPCQSGCDYTTSTLLDPTAVPTFDNNIEVPLETGINITSLDNYNTPESCTINGTSYAGQEIAVQFQSSPNGLQAGATAKIASAGGTVNASSIVEPNANEIDFCVVSGDVPGAYTLSIINPDGGHWQTSLTEAPIIRSANFANGTETLTGGGFENGGTITVGGTACSATSCTVSYLGGPDTATIPSFTGPTNGATTKFVVTNPDNTTANFTVTAPTASAAGLAAVTGQTVSDTLTGTGFTSGLAIKSQTSGCNATVTDTTGTTGALTFTSPSLAAGSTCAIQFINPDGGTTSTLSIPVDAPPSATGASPSVFFQGQTTTLNVTGTGFQTGMTATVSGGCTAPSVSVTSATTATLTATASTTATQCTVALTNPDQGTSPTYTVGVDAPPNITSYTVSLSGTTKTALVHSTSYTWTVNGTGFVSGSTVSVTENGTALTGITATTITSTKITFTLSTNATKYTSAAPFIVTVTNPDTGTDTQSNSYKVS